MFCSLNRWLGFPQRIFIETNFAFKNLVEAFNGNRPCFVSVAKFKGKNEPFMEYFPFDLDSKINWRIPYKETNKLLDFYIKKDIPHKTIISGGKGFHSYFEFEEEPVNDSLYSKIYSIQYSLKKYLNLQTTDNPLFGKTALMIRLPTTKYVAIRNKGKTKTLYSNDNYCRYLPDEDFNKGLKQIEKLTLTPGIIPKLTKNKPTIDDIISTIPNFKYKEKSNGYLDIDLKPGGILTPTLKAVALPCLQKIAAKNNPSHSERLELVAWLKLQGYRDMAITTFIRTLNKNNHWLNYNKTETLNNVISVRPRFPSCTTLRETYSSLCSNCLLNRKKDRRKK